VQTPAPQGWYQRRSKRFLVTVAAEVKWHGLGAVRIKEKAHAEVVNAHGGLLRMNTYPNVGDIIELTNLFSSESVEGRMLAVRGSTAEASQGIVQGIENFKKKLAVSKPKRNNPVGKNGKQRARFHR
jgi:hypothetical protein